MSWVAGSPALAAADASALMPFITDTASSRRLASASATLHRTMPWESHSAK